VEKPAQSAVALGTGLYRARVQWKTTSKLSANNNVEQLHTQTHIRPPSDTLPEDGQHVYKLPECNITSGGFNELKLLHQHMIKFHSYNFPISCPVYDCPDKGMFPSFIELDTHMQSAHLDPINAQIAEFPTANGKHSCLVPGCNEDLRFEKTSGGDSQYSIHLYGAHKLLTTEARIIYRMSGQNAVDKWSAGENCLSSSRGILTLDRCNRR
jgi:hypothetical protein